MANIYVSAQVVTLEMTAVLVRVYFSEVCSKFSLRLIGSAMFGALLT